MPSITPIISIFLAMSIHIVCNPMDNSLQMSTIHSNTAINEVVHESLGISGLQNEAFVPQKQAKEPHTISGFVTSGQNSLGKIQSSSGSKESKGKKLFRFDLNLPFESQCTEEEDQDPKRRKINDGRETDEDIQEVENHHPDHCQYSSSSDSMGLLSKLNQHTRVMGKASDCRNSVPTEGYSSTTTESQSQQAVQPISLIGSCSMDQGGSSEIVHKGRAQFHKYHFKKSGASVMLPDHKVRVIGNSWHSIPEINHMFEKMVYLGRQVASETGLENEMKRWFQLLKRDIVSKHINSVIFQQESRKVFRTLSKAYRQFTLVFLGSLQVIHSTPKEEMKELVYDGWAFIMRYLEVWRWIDLEHCDVPTMAIKPETLEIENPLQLWHYLMGLARTSRMSLIVLWRFCNHWYHLSSYKNKMMIKNHQDLHVRWHYHLAKANLLPDWEIEPEPPATISSSGQSGLEINMKNTKSPLYRFIRKENFSVKEGRSKRFVGILREVGRNTLFTLNPQQLPFKSIQTYCQTMKNKKLKLPQEWQGNFESLKQKTIFGIIPCFLGMIQLLHPIEVSNHQPNPAILDALKFMKEFLSGWGKDDLEKSFRINPLEIKQLSKSDEPSRDCFN
ncbi:uncharacterized protein MELLADRAFT_61872 [Melampsora larici-populina 98AG31]|uniref:Secreted protein n=1 Tax=Melampsora larici-populina (strain 98AG31 / pathotype 3-4-7) TaxID=747676 RepID=F4RG71_MELLP|nr:uncharacterized protein MELLADRAFT_61872 [Melampsora larici-populina 98AG31]EGG08558.1 hypothetical protein MELLADRAFT_61872 [Melampsora larici-populina 98AG31]